MPAAPQWALFVGSLGRDLVALGLVAFLLSALAWALAGRNVSLEKLGKAAFAVGAYSVFGAIVCLGALFVKEQFEFDYVRRCIQAGLELKYRVAAIWSHQEGSFLLWTVASAIFGLLAARGMGLYRRWFTFAYSLFLASLCAILSFETPFKLDLIDGRPLIPPDGLGLTPSLQNYWVVIHPPTIFLGFGSLTIMFAATVAALLTRNAQDWVKLVRPWALLSLAILGLGLCMGGFWAYETLGWGGFWAWDPVENASFVPWMLTATFIHGLIVQSSRKGWTRANLLFGALPFLAFVYGTYLTRSGVLGDQSLHSFAQMDRSALKILLGLMAVAGLGFAALLKVRWNAFAPDAPAEPGLNRTAGYTAGALVLSGIGVVAGLGMSVPLVNVLMHQPVKIVEEPLYHQVLGWFFPVFMVLMAAVPFVSWRKTGWKALFTKLGTAFSFAFMFAGIAFYGMRTLDGELGPDGAEQVAFPFGKTFPAYPWLAFLIFLCAFAAIANLGRIYELRKQMKLGLGGFLSHIGVATLMAGMILSRGLERKQVEVIQPGQSVSALGYVIEYKKFTKDSIEDRDNKVEFFLQGKDSSFYAYPGLYSFGAEQGQPKWMTWPHIQRFPAHDVYFTLSSPQLDVWENPESMKVGATHTANGVTITYEKMNVHGKFGQPGTQFGAVLNVVTRDSSYKVEPTLEISPGGMVPHLAKVGSDLFVSMQAIQPGDRSAMIQVHFSKPLYQIQLFYKPMTSLVWLGAGILTLGAAMAALYRRKAVAAAPESPAPTLSKPPAEDAIVPAPQM